MKVPDIEISKDDLMIDKDDSFYKLFNRCKNKFNALKFLWNQKCYKYEKARRISILIEVCDKYQNLEVLNFLKSKNKNNLFSLYIKSMIVKCKKCRTKEWEDYLFSLKLNLGTSSIINCSKQFQTKNWMKLLLTLDSTSYDLGQVLSKVKKYRTSKYIKLFVSKKPLLSQVRNLLMIPDLINNKYLIEYYHSNMTSSEISLAYTFLIKPYKQYQTLLWFNLVKQSNDVQLIQNLINDFFYLVPSDFHHYLMALSTVEEIERV